MLRCNRLMLSESAMAAVTSINTKSVKEPYSVLIGKHCSVGANYYLLPDKLKPPKLRALAQDRQHIHARRQS
jgi:hypothetical protein